MMDQIPFLPEAFKPHLPKIVEPKNPRDPECLPPGVEKSVLLVGGGLAAHSSAMELAERGYKVKIVEARDVLGGRLSTEEKETALGKKKVIHGHHEFFANYYVLNDLLGRLGLDENFRPHNAVDFVFRDYAPEKLSSTPPLYPLNLLGIVFRSPNLRSRLLGILKSTPGFLDIMYYNTETTRRRWDGKTFKQWADARGIDKAMWDIILEPAASVTLNDVEKLSAAQMLELMHIYFISQPHAMERRVATEDHETSIMKPWRDYLESKGVEFELNHAVRGLRFEGGKAVGEIDTPARYDWVILATDVSGTQKVLAGSEADASTTAALRRMRETNDKLKVAPQYHVLRVWLDKPAAANRPDILETPQHRPINLIAQFNLIEKEAAEWARTSGGSVFEFHLYNTPEMNGMSPETIWKKIKSVVDEVLPELADAKVLAATVNEREDFTSYEVGQSSIRPSVDFPQRAGISNLMQVGDYVQTKSPSALMERAVLTGREAANVVLLADRVRQAKVPVLTSKGPGIL